MDCSKTIAGLLILICGSISEIYSLCFSLRDDEVSLSLLTRETRDSTLIHTQ